MSQEDTSVVQDAGPSEPIETVDDNVALEDIEISFDDAEDDTDEEAATESEEVEPASDPEPEAVEEKEPEAESEPEKSEDPADEEPEAAEIDPVAERKRFNDEMAKQRIAERQAREEARQAREALEATQLENYLAEVRDDPEEFAQRQLDVEAYKLQEDRINLNAEKLQVSIDKALSNIDLFSTGTPAVKERLLRAIDDFEANNVTKDAKGRPVEVKGDLLQHLQKEAASIRDLLQEGAVQQTKSKEKTKSKTLAPPSRSPKPVKTDPDLDGFDEEAKRW